jgi:hypothetical protein
MEKPVELYVSSKTAMLFPTETGAAYGSPYLVKVGVILIALRTEELEAQVVKESDCLQMMSDRTKANLIRERLHEQQVH